MDRELEGEERVGGRENWRKEGKEGVGEKGERSEMRHRVGRKWGERGRERREMEGERES